MITGADEVRSHVPVLLEEVMGALALPAGGICIDGTFGAGGYTRAILNAGAGRVIAIDRDPDAIAAGQAFRDACGGRLDLIHGRFSTLDAVAIDAGADIVDGVVLDIGVSSMQLDQPGRGFSFMAAGPLDMRMAQDGPTAGDLVNGESDAALARILWAYGEEKKSRQIAKAIVTRRASKPFTTTDDLASLVSEVIGRTKSDRHPATRTFQALRIAVNRELEELAGALFAAERVLKPGGRLVVVTFHSLEDRIVKRFFRDRSSSRPRGSRHAPESEGPAPSFQIVNLPALGASEEEVNVNPRARSATLRAGIRTEAPAHPADLRGLGLPKVETLISQA
ncbi:MAG: 16S rRNA (cytosine(1402)-N(4))-methyltransferase RsmH [Hyphomicrobiaceae bacterium]